MVTNTSCSIPGASDLLIGNAKTLGVDLSLADAVVLSHGHYDHTGGLEAVLDIADHAVVYLHPDAVMGRFSCKPSGAKPIGMSATVRACLACRHVVWTESPVEIFPGLWVTGAVPRTHDIEDVGGPFFRDPTCHVADPLADDQSLFIESASGTILLTGCAHAGIVNTMDYVATLTGRDSFYTVAGGMHLLHASQDRIAYTQQAFERLGVEHLAPAHCTGSHVITKFNADYADTCMAFTAGTVLTLPSIENLARK